MLCYFVVVKLLPKLMTNYMVYSDVQTNKTFWKPANQAEVQSRDHRGSRHNHTSQKSRAESIKARSGPRENWRQESHSPEKRLDKFDFSFLSPITCGCWSWVQQVCIKVGVLTDLASERKISTTDQQKVFSSLHVSLSVSTGRCCSKPLTLPSNLEL